MYTYMYAEHTSLSLYMYIYIYACVVNTSQCEFPGQWRREAGSGYQYERGPTWPALVFGPCMRWASSTRPDFDRSNAVRKKAFGAGGFQVCQLTRQFRENAS